MLACACCGSLWLDAHAQRRRCPVCGCTSSTIASEGERSTWQAEYWRIRALSPDQWADCIDELRKQAAWVG